MYDKVDHEGRDSQVRYRGRRHSTFAVISDAPTNRPFLRETLNFALAIFAGSHLAISAHNLESHSPNVESERFCEGKSDKLFCVAAIPRTIETHWKRDIDASY